MMNNPLFPNPLEILSRLKSAVKTGAKTFTGATKRAERGTRDILGAFKPETYVAEQDRSVPSVGKRPLVNRLQQAGLGATDITGALGQGALALPAMGFGLFKPEMEAVVKAGSKVVPEAVKKASKNFFKKVSETVPEDIKRQAGSAAYSAIGLSLLAKTPWGQAEIKTPQAVKNIAQSTEGKARFFDKDEGISMNEYLRKNPKAAKALFKNTTLDKSGRIVPKKPTK